MRWIWLIIMTVTMALAQIPANVLNAVQKNPALLDTPQGQILLKQYGVSKSQVLGMVNRSSATMPKAAGVTQAITTTQASQTIVNAAASVPLNTGNPLHYVSGEQLIKRIKKWQQRGGGAKGLKQFGYNFFANANTFNPAILPTPDYYVLTPGDVLLIETYGSTNKRYTLPIDNNGNIMIPVIGPKLVAGKTFGQVKKELADIIAKTFPGLKATVNIKKFSTIQVILTGEAAAPGIYNLPALSTVQTLLVQSKGVLSTGSLRKVEIYRNGKKLATVDLYNLLTGHPTDEPLLRAGDIVYVPHAGKKVAIYGEVKKAAIYELKPGEKGDALLRYAGGLTPKADADAIVVKRYDNHHDWKSYRMTLAQFKTFRLHDGDQIVIYPLGGLQQENVYLFGNIIKPGPRALTAGDHSLHDLLHKEAPEKLDQLLLPDTYLHYAFIKRLENGLHERIIGFDLMAVYQGKKDVTLQKEDEIYVLNRYEVMESPYVFIHGQTLRPGMYRYLDGMTLSDLINAAGIQRLADENVRITTYATPDHLPKTLTVNYREHPDFALHPYDEIYLFDYYQTHIIAKARIDGQVVKPGNYAIKEGTPLHALIDAAGGLTERASKKGEIVRFYVKDGERKRKIIPVKLDEKGLQTPLKNHDIVTIFQIPKWRELKRVTLKGEIKYPGTYVIEGDETLADVIERAGGFTDDAFLYGAVFTRQSVKKLQKMQLTRALQRMKKRAMIIAAQPKDFGEGNTNAQQVLNSIDTVIRQAQKIQPMGRITIDLTKDLKAFRKSHNNIILKDGDTLYVPTKTDTVSVLGEVLNPTAMVYDPSYSVWDYIDQAGGLSDNANQDSIYVVHANGKAEKVATGFFVNSQPKIKPGDSIVAPIYIKEISNLKITKDATQVIYQIAVSIAALSGIGAL